MPAVVNFAAEPHESCGLCPVTYNPFLSFAAGSMGHILLQIHTKVTIMVQNLQTKFIYV